MLTRPYLPMRFEVLPAQQCRALQSATKFLEDLVLQGLQVFENTLLLRTRSGVNAGARTTLLSNHLAALVTTHGPLRVFALLHAAGPVLLNLGEPASST